MARIISDKFGQKNCVNLRGRTHGAAVLGLTLLRKIENLRFAPSPLGDSN
jgi:hypothetical protein